MYENSAPTPKLIWIEEQPDFPAVDLTDANTDSLNTYSRMSRVSKRTENS